jgi:peptidoglycan/LPS O-acetylase OafA/YrhL
MRPLGHRPALDGLRGLAVASVVVYHCWPAILPGGWVGVDLFFVLSGFLITSLLIEELSRTGAVDLGRFYARRALRLLPALALTLVLTLLVADAIGTAMFGETAKEAVTSVLYVSNWYLSTRHGQPFGLLSQMWSLSVEEQFYLVWPLLLVLLLRLGGRRLALGVCVAGVGLIMLHRGSVSGASGVYFRTDTHGDSLLVGAIFALLRSSGWRPSGWSIRVPAALGVVAVGLTMAFTTSNGGAHGLGYGGIAVGAGFVVIAAVEASWSPLSWRPLVALGRISYGVYLFNFPTARVLIFALGGHGPRVLLLTAVITLAFASFSYRYVEQPCLRLKRRVASRGTPTAALPSAA